ncbi:MAG: winged helix-turn-helix domain-containing protein [Anaerolineaceae bacterium]
MEKVMEQYKVEELYYLENLDQMEAFSSRIRYRMVVLLAYTPKTAAQLAREVEVSRPKAHYHLQVLVKMGLVVFVYEKLVNGIMEKYYIGRAHFYSFDKLSEYAASHPNDTAFAKKLGQLQNDFLLNVLDLSRERVSQVQKEDPSLSSYLFDFGCRLTDAQINEVLTRLSELSQMIRDFHAENVKLPGYKDLLYYKNILLMLPQTPQTDLIKKGHKSS